MMSESLSIRNLKFRQDNYSQGVAEGEKKGIIEGEKKGIIEGEKKKSMDIAHKLHLMSHLGLSAEEISDITGCSSLEIKKFDQN